MDNEKLLAALTYCWQMAKDGQTVLPCKCESKCTCSSEADERALKALIDEVKGNAARHAVLSYVDFIEKSAEKMLDEMDYGVLDETTGIRIQHEYDEKYDFVITTDGVSLHIPRNADTQALINRMLLEYADADYLL